jgi:hypothetical protein
MPLAPEVRRAVKGPPAGSDETSRGVGGRLKGPAPVIEPLSPGPRRSAPSSATRLIVSTGLIVSLFLLLVAYLDRSSQSSAIFGFLTVLFFLLLLRLPKNR